MWGGPQAGLPLLAMCNVPRRVYLCCGIRTSGRWQKGETSVMQRLRERIGGARSCRSSRTAVMTEKCTLPLCDACARELQVPDLSRSSRTAMLIRSSSTLRKWKRPAPSSAQEIRSERSWAPLAWHTRSEVNGVGASLSLSCTQHVGGWICGVSGAGCFIISLDLRRRFIISFVLEERHVTSAAEH
jgi:hypothetical protein